MSGLHRKPALGVADSSPFPLIAKFLIKSKLENEDRLVAQLGVAGISVRRCHSACQAVT